MANQTTIWHYPRCSKSRKTLAILRDEELHIDVRRYLDDPPDADELAEAVEQLGIAPEELVRKKEDIYADLDVDEDNFDDADWIELLTDNPRLIQRPIVFTDHGVALGRPPESVYEILPSTVENSAS